MNRIHALSVVACLAVSLATIETAKADTLSFSAAIPLQQVAYTKTVNLTKFDTNLGTLTGVSIQLDTIINATVRVGNFNPPDKSYSFAQASIPLTITGPDSSVVTATAVASVSYNPPRTVATGTIDENTGLSATATKTAAIPMSGFAQYQGVGSQTLVLNAAAGSATASGTGDPDLFYAATGSAGGTVKVTYTYTATTNNTVPEPGTLGLLTLSAAPMGLVAVRRRAAKA